MIDLKLQAAVEVSTESAVRALDKVGVEAGKMASKVGQEAQKAGAAVDSIGSGAGASADQLTKAEGKMVASIKRIQTQMDLAGKSASQKLEFNISSRGLDASKFEPMLAKMRETEAAQASLASGSSDLSTKLGAISVGAVAAIAAFKGIASSMIDAQQQSQKLKNSLEYSAGGAIGAAKEIEYLREVTMRLGIDFATSSQAYAKFAASTKDSGISLSQTKTVFEGVAAASARLGLSADETQGALLALSQMASKGTVSAEELRGQLAERLPGALKIAANALGVTQTELNKMLETGQIMASDFLPKFGQSLKDNFQAPLESLTQEINRFNSAWLLWKQELSEGANGGGFKWLTNGLNESTAAMRALGTEAGLTQRLLVAIGGFEAGAVGVTKFNPEKLQAAAMNKLPAIRSQRLELEGKDYLTQFEKQTLADLQRQEFAIRKNIEGLAAQRGKKSFAIPDLAEEYYAEQKKQADKLSAYTKDLTNAPKAVKLSADIEKENVAFRAAVAGLSENDSRYESALKTHNERVAAIKEKSNGSAASEYDKLRDSLAKYLPQLKEEIDGTDKLTASQKIGLEIKRKLSASEQKKLEPMLAQVAAAEHELALRKQIEEADKEASRFFQQRAEAEQKSAQTVVEDTKKIKEHTAEIGLSTGAIEAIKATRDADTIALKEHELAELESTGQVTAYSEALRANIAALKERQQALQGQSDKQITYDAAKKAADEWTKTSEKIGDSITLALMRGFESGKSFAMTLRDTVVNMFKTMVLQPVIKATVIGGMSAMGMGSANATEGNSASSLLNSGSSAYNAYTGGSGLYTDFALSGAGSALGLSTGLSTSLGVAGGAGSTMGASAALAAAEATSAGATGLTALGSTIGAAMPYVAAAIALYTVVSSLMGSDTGNKTEGDYFGKLNADGSLTKQGEETGGGGVWYTRDSADAQMAALSPAIGKSVYETVKALGGNSAGIGINFGYNTDPKGKAPDNISAAVTDASGKYVYGQAYNVDKGGASAAMQVEMQRITLAAIRAASGIKPIFRELTDGIDIATATAETLNQVMSDVTYIKTIEDAFGTLHLNADALNITLIKTAGGAKTLADNLGAYYSAYFSETEKAQKLSTDTAKAFADIGLAMPSTKAAFRGLVEGLDLTTTAGQETFAALMNLSPAFAQVADSMEAMKTAAASSLSGEMESLLAVAEKQVSQAMDSLTRSVNAEKTKLQANYDSAISAINKQLEVANSNISRMTSLSASLKNALASLKIAGSDSVTRSNAQAEIATALAIAKAGGSLPMDGALDQALQAVAQPSEALYGSFVEYARDFYRTANDISELGNLTNASLSIEEKMKRSLDEQTVAIKSQYDADVSYYDAMLENAQKQIDAVNGVDLSVKSLSQAMSDFAMALSTMGAVKPLTTIPKTSVTQTGALNGIVTAYQTILGRAPDAAGLSYWLSQSSSGASLDDISSGIAGSSENKVDDLYGSLLGRDADSAGMAYWADALSNGASVADVSAAIMASDEYKNSHATGLTRVPYDGYKATLHEGEAVVDSSSVQAISRYFSTPREGNVIDITPLLEEIKSLRAEIRTGQAQIASGTNKTAKQLERWDVDGMPAVVTV